MSSLKGKKILLGVSGSIAAYKAAFLVRQLVKDGCAVRVIMTDSASDFVSAPNGGAWRLLSHDGPLVGDSGAYPVCRSLQSSN